MAAATAAPRESFPGAIRRAARAGLARPALGLYLLALLALGWKWLSPIASLYERAGWSDILIALAAAAWARERIQARSLPAVRPFHLTLAAYLAWATVSTAFAVDRGTAATNLLLMAELAVLAVLTSELAVEREARDAIVVAVAVVALATAALALIGLGLFYAGEHTSLIGVYGEQFTPSRLYARVAAGFATPPLLASFCIFASAVVARADAPLSAPTRRLVQAALALTVVATLSRGILAFLAAWAIRWAYAHRPSRAAALPGVGAVVAAVAVLAVLTVGRLHVDPGRPALSYHVPDPGNRREAIVSSWQSFERHPLVGEGPGALTGQNRGVPFRAHLTPLNIAATMGAPALAAFTLLGVVLWRHRRRPTPIATWSGLAGLALDGLAQDIDHFRHVWVMIGLADADRALGEDGRRGGPGGARAVP
jgi:hypothetical protein